jgi:hypothetical protein
MPGQGFTPAFTISFVMVDWPSTGTVMEIGSAETLATLAITATARQAIFLKIVFLFIV